VDAVPGSYQAQPAPSWLSVIATTLQLWLRRRVPRALRVPDGPDAVRLARRRRSSQASRITRVTSLRYSRSCARSAPRFWATATVSGTGAAAVLRIVFTAPCPLGLLSAQTSQ
jgi:hypothetical protein